MSNVENRIVSMTFDNERFERNLAATMTSLDKLNETLKFAGTKEGLSDLGTAFDGTQMAASVDNISSKFSALGAVGFTVIQKLTNAVLDFAKNVGEKIVGPIMSGGRARAENIEQAMFMFRGLDMDIEASMASALEAVKGTAYGLDVAAKAAAQMGGSGLRAGEDMTGALRGIAGIAAMTNSSYEEMADIFISAAGNGRVMSNELGRISHRGVNAAAALAKVWGITEAEVREMVSDGLVSFDMFAKGMDAAFGEHSQKANETYTGSLANMRAALSRLGASFFGPHLTQQRDLFNALTPVIDNVHTALKPLIKAMIELKGIGTENLIKFLENIDFSNLELAIPNVAQGFKNAFEGISEFLGVIKEAFREIFPPSTTSLLISLSEAFLRFSERLKMGGETADKVKSIFKGIFSIFSIGMEIVKGLAGLFVSLFSAITGSTGIGGGILDFFANIGDSLSRLNDVLVTGGGIAKFFETIKNIFSGGEAASSGAISNTFDRLGERLDMLGSASERVGDAWQRMSERFAGVRRVLDRLWTYISNWFSELGSKLAKVMKPGDFDAAIDVVNIGLLGGIALMLKKFMTGGVNLRVTTGIVERMRLSFLSLHRSLTALQMDLKAKALLKIAGAVAILAGSVLVLSTIDSAALTKALAAMTVGFAQLMGTFALLEKASLGTSSLRLNMMAGSMILLATAMGVLSLAVKNLSSMGWEELAKGLIGVTVMLVGMTASTQLISANTAGMVRAGIGMTAIATALLILSKAVKSFAEMSWQDMAKGLTGVAVGLGAIVIAMKFMPPSMAITGAGLVAVAVGLRILAEAVEAFGDISWEEMGRGLVGIGGALVIVAGAMNLMPLNLPITASGLVILSFALLGMAKAVKSMGSIEWEQMAKGIGGLAVMLGVLVVAMNLMNGSVLGASALVIVSGALLVLVEVLKKLSKFSIAELATGLGALAAVFLVLGAAGLVLGPITPVLFGLGVAMGLVGGSFALFGTGAILVAKSFELMAKAGKKGVDVIIHVIKRLIMIVPEVAQALVSAFMDVATQLFDAAPVLIKGATVLLSHILDTVIELVPKISEALSVIITEFLTLIRDKVPEFIETGFTILLAFLSGIRDNIGEIVTVVADIVIGFIDALANKVPALVDSAYNLIFTVLTEIAEKLGSSGPALFVAVGKSLIDGFIKGLKAVFPELLTWFKELPGKILDIVKSLLGIDSPSKKFVEIGVDIVTGLLNGLVDTIGQVMTWFTELPGKIFGWIGDVTKTLTSKGVGLITGFISGYVSLLKSITEWYISLPGKIVEWIGDVSGTLKDKGISLISGLLRGLIERFVEVTNWVATIAQKIVSTLGDMKNVLLQLGKNIMQGLWDGLKSKWNEVTGWLKKLNPASWFNDINPYKGHAVKNLLTTGGAVMQGLWNGMKSKWDDVSKWLKSIDPSKSIGTQTAKAMSSTVNSIINQLDGIEDFNPTITPVLDLTKVQAASKGLNKLLAVSSIAPEVSLDRARQISTTTDLAREGKDTPVYTGPSEVTFEQNIFSPTALSTNDIYRNTKSQIALAKEELNIA